MYRSIVIFPNGTEGPLFKDFGFCTVPLLDDSLLETCNNEKLTFRDVMSLNIPDTPDVPYSFIQVI